MEIDLRLGDTHFSIRVCRYRRRLVAGTYDLQGQASGAITKRESVFSMCGKFMGLYRLNASSSLPYRYLYITTHIVGVSSLQSALCMAGS